MSGLPLGIVQPPGGHPGKMISNRKRNLKDQDTESMSLAALMFLFSFFTFHFDTLLHESLYEFFTHFWKSAFASLPSTTARNIETSGWRGSPKNRDFALKAQILMVFFINFVTGEWDRKNREGLKIK